MKVILIGFMGSGKSTVGAALAKKLAFDFLEMDLLLVERSQFTSIPQIFAERGEAYFRDQETALAETLANRSKVVISTGGGTPCRDENMIALKKDKALTVYLSVSFEIARERVGNDSTRPLWKNIADTKALFEQRGPIYTKAADIVVDGSRDPAVIANEIQQSLAQRRD